MNDRSYRIPVLGKTLDLLPVGGRLISHTPHPPSGARQRLLDAALLEFARAGFDGASIRTIMKLLGMRESGFYAHFPSKQAAYDALFEEGSPALVTQLVSHIAADQAPDAALRRLAGEIMEAWSAPRARLLSSIVLRELFSGRSEKHQELLTAIDEAQKRVGHLIAAWQQRGAIRDEADPTSLAFEFLSPLLMLRILHFNHASTIEELREGDIRIARHVETFLQMVLVTPE